MPCYHFLLSGSLFSCDERSFLIVCILMKPGSLLSSLFMGILMSTAVTWGGERISFDHEWQFKYLGKIAPEMPSCKVSADSEQAGHPASHAVDGSENTRWCANDGKGGHAITISPELKEKAKQVRIIWENARKKQIEVTLKSGSKKSKIKQTTKGRETIIDIDNQRVSSLKIAVSGTGDGNWASIREVEFLSESGEVLPVQARCAESMAGFAAKGYKNVQLPHDWAVESPFLADEPNETGKLPWVGYGWYRREFNVSAEFDAEKTRCYLDFDGVMSSPQVYVNGRKAGDWAYGYTSFRVDITPHIRKGRKNAIAVLVGNKPQSTRWYPGAGIYRHVWMEKTDPIHIDQWGVYVTTPNVTEKSATVALQTTICNTSADDAELVVTQQVGGASAEPVTVKIKAGDSKTVRQKLELKSPVLWSCENPHLYTVTTSVRQGNRFVDSCETTFGVRTVEWKSDGFYLNGKRVQLKGVCEHHDLGPLGAAFHERAYERKIEILKEMGCNAIRMTHNPPAPQVLDLCDKHGMLVVNELFDIWKYQKYDKVNGYHLLWADWWKMDVARFLRRDRNHPCVIAWSGGNEVPEITKPEGIEISAQLRDEMKKYDETRPYTVGTNAAQGADNGFGDTQDAFGYNYKPSQYAGYAKRHPDKPFYGSETASCVGTRDTYVFPLRWDVKGGYTGEGAIPFQVSSYGLAAPGWGYCPDVEFAAQDATPKVAGEFVWTGFDYLGEPTPYNQDATIEGNIKHLPEKERKALMREYRKLGNKAPSRSSYFGIVDLAGFPKDTYYLYRSRWAADKAHAHLLPHWNWRGREGKVTPVMCFSSGDEAELFLNGKSQGVRRKGEGDTFTQAGVTVKKNAYRFVWESVKYEPGELKVVVKKNGKPWAEATRCTAGKAVAVQAQVDRPEIVGDARDLAYISLAVVDAKGNVIPTDCRNVSFRISGPAELVGFCNGNPIDHTCMKNPKQGFFNGRIVAVVRAHRKGEGSVEVAIKADKLPELTVPLQVKKATRAQLSH